MIIKNGKIITPYKILSGYDVLVDNGVIKDIGKNLSVESAYLALRDEPSLEVSIGNDCMFSSDIYIRTSDAHTIYDDSTKVLYAYNREQT